MRMIDCSGWCRLPGRLAAWVFTEVGVHIRFRGHGGLGFRPYGGSLGKAPSNQGLLPLSYGGSPRLAIPSLRSCSVGPPPSAIHGRGRLTRHPCRVAHCAEPPLGLSMGRAPQKTPRGGLPAGLPLQAYALPLWERACSRRGRVNRHQWWMPVRLREQARSHIWIFARCGICWSGLEG